LLPELDQLLKGGILSSSLTEVVGPAGAGKSQFCQMLCVSSILEHPQAATTGQHQQVYPSSPLLQVHPSSPLLPLFLRFFFHLSLFLPFHLFSPSIFSPFFPFTARSGVCRGQMLHFFRHRAQVLPLPPHRNCIAQRALSVRLCVRIIGRASGRQLQKGVGGVWRSSQFDCQLLPLATLP
jgi:hypothetical protein